MSKVIPSLTGMRGILALWVLMLHVVLTLYLVFGVKVEMIFGSIVTNFILAGYLAVDLFFVISGFVLSYLYIEEFTSWNRNNYQRFIVSRFARIYPVHIFMIALYALLIFGFGLTFESFCFPFNVDSTCQRYGIEEMYKNILLVQSWEWFPQTTWNVVSWSISSEWAMYIIFPFIAVIFLSNISEKRNSIWLLLLAVTFSTLCTFILLNADSAQSRYNDFMNMVAFSKQNFLNEFYSEASPRIVEFGLVRVLFGFIVGCLLGCFYRMRINKGLFIHPVYEVMLFLAFVVLIAIKQTEFALIVGTAFLFVTTIAKGVVSSFLNSRAIVFLGRISYSLYMVHVLILKLGMMALLSFSDKLTIQQSHAFAILGLVFVYVVAALICAVLLHNIIEEPLRTKIKRAYNKYFTCTKIVRPSAI